MMNCPRPAIGLGSFTRKFRHQMSGSLHLPLIGRLSVDALCSLHSYRRLCNGGDAANLRLLTLRRAVASRRLVGYSLP